ncbi:MAG: FtsX-like permease family protein [Candidatus Merdivicinus sp.]|jgi:putative ABC transport system permease protein
MRRKRNQLLHEMVRSVWRTRTRFLSILAIVAIGCGFFAGVKASCPDMKLTADQYFEESRLMDLHLVSTFGFNENDIEAIETVDGIRGMMAGYSTDAFLEAGDSSNTIVKAYSLPAGREEEGENYLNRPMLTEGRFPEKSGECVVERNMHTPEEFQLGNTIRLLPGSEDTELSDTLKTDTYTIVGIVESAMYIGFDRGHSTIGDGEVDAFLMVPEEDFSLDVYTDVYLTLQSTAGLSAFEDAYADAVDLASEGFESVAELRGEERYDEIYEEAQAEIDNAKAELADGEQTQAEELAKAEKEIADAEKELDNGQSDYDRALARFNREIADAEERLADGETQLKEGEDAYEKALAQYESGLSDYQAQLPEAQAQIAAYQAQADQLEAEAGEAIRQADAARASLTAMQEVLKAFAETSLPAGQVPEDTQAAITAADGLSALLPEEALPSGVSLSAMLTQYVTSEGAAKQALGRKLEQIAGSADETLRPLEEELVPAKTALEQLTAGIASAQAEYEEAKADSDAELEDARRQIADAERDLADLKEPTWYVWNRNNNPDYSNYSEDSEKVDAVAAVFPVFFILVAALVCLTTMTRMVEEQRTQIGTLKALGYSRGAIMAKYLAYAMAASLTGAVVGLAIGFKLFPYVIINAYKAMYNLPTPLTPIHWAFGAACTAVAVVCMGLTTLGACTASMREFPAQLMRPKAPKAGKRVLLERVTFIWKRLNFTQKVTIRNLFRYKRRALMTIVGIAGCTALMLTGFGLRYAIVSIGEKQYSSIFVYDTLAALEENLTGEQAGAALDSAVSMGDVENGQLLYTRSLDVSAGGIVRTINLMVPEDPEGMRNYIDLHERIGGENLALTDDGVIINEKLGKILKVGVGDEISLINPDGRPIRVTVTGVNENYALNYVYMTPALYTEQFRSQPSYNEMLLNLAQEADESVVSSELMKLSEVQGVAHTSGINSDFSNMLGSLNSIVWVLIFSAGALAVVVLYNLANINVNERVRELATIKVLGFYDKEVTSYITRENTISAILGMLIGLVGGIALERFVVLTAEVDIVMFAPDMSWDCYVFAGLLTMLFAMAVNFFLHFRLKKIDMVESLKSVE